MTLSPQQVELQYRHAPTIGLDAIQLMKDHEQLVEMAMEQVTANHISDAKKLSRIETLLDNFLLATGEPLNDMRAALEYIQDEALLPMGYRPEGLMSEGQPKSKKAGKSKGDIKDLTITARE